MEAETNLYFGFRLNATTSAPILTNCSLSPEDSCTLTGPDTVAMFPLARTRPRVTHRNVLDRSMRSIKQRILFDTVNQLENSGRWISYWMYILSYLLWHCHPPSLLRSNELNITVHSVLSIYDFFLIKCMLIVLQYVDWWFGNDWIFLVTNFIYIIDNFLF